MKRESESYSIPCADSMITGSSEIKGVEAISNARPAVGVAQKPVDVSGAAGEPALHELKRKTGPGALVFAVGQGANFFFRIGSMVVLARLLVPEYFGLVGMVTACTGFLGMFRDAGLSMATVQRVSITRAQTS